MEYYELIQTRESVRNYDPGRPVPKEIIEKILDAGRLAPSACNLQPWKFLVISSHKILEKVGACRIAAFNPSMLAEVIKPGEGETIFAITPLGYPKPDFKKASKKE